MRTLYSFIFMTFLAVAAFAQTTEKNDPQFTPASVNELATSEKPASSQFNHIFSVNFIPLFGLFYDSPGLGLGYQFILDSHYSIGANLYYKKQHPFVIFQDEVTIRYFNVGIEARYKISSVYENGFYGGIGLTSSGVQGEVEMRSLLGDSMGRAEASYQWITLLVPRLGYSWAPKSKKSYGDLSVSYEAVDEVDYTYQSGVKNSQSSSMEIKKRKIGTKLTYVIGFVF